MDIEEAKNFARNKIEADTLTQQVIADFVRDANGYVLAQPKSKKPREETLDYIKTFNILSIYTTNISNLKYYKTKSGSGIAYSNNPHQLLDRLELLGGSILAGNNGVFKIRSL